MRYHYGGLASISEQLGLCRTGICDIWRSQFGIAMANNGKLYCGPLSATSVLVIDPNTNISSLISSGLGIAGAEKWRGIVNAPNGKLYCVPSEANTVLKIDPNTNTTNQIVSSYSIWSEGATVGGDGVIYGASRDGSWILMVIHVDSSSASCVASANTCEIQFMYT